MTSHEPEPRGSRLPRHLHVPPSQTSSAGQEAVDLAKVAGLNLDPWQETILEHALGERQDGQWSAFEVGVVVPRQNGKGALLEARELAGLFLFNEDLILHSAHEFKTAQEAFRRISTLVQNTPDLYKRVKRISTSHGDEGIELKNGKRLRFVARSRGSGRGFSGDCVILDEAYYLSPDAMAALLPTLSARPNPQLWYTSSAPLLESEVLRRLCKRGRAGESARLAFFEYCASKDMDPGDVQAWADANPALDIRIAEEFIDAEYHALGEEEFLRERLGIWPEEGVEAVIDLNLWGTLADTESQALDPVAFAADISPGRDSASIGSSGRRDDGMGHLEVVNHRSGTDWVVPRLVELAERWGPCVIVIDPAGPAGALIPELAEHGICVDPTYGQTKLELVNARTSAQACGALYDAAHNNGIRHLDQGPLNTALAGAKKRPLGDAWAWHRQDSTVDISPLVAVTLAQYGFSVYGPAEKIDVSGQIF